MFCSHLRVARRPVLLPSSGDVGAARAWLWAGDGGTGGLGPGGRQAEVEGHEGQVMQKPGVVQAEERQVGRPPLGRGGLCTVVGAVRPPSEKALKAVIFEQRTSVDGLLYALNTLTGRLLFHVRNVFFAVQTMDRYKSP